MTPFEQAMAAFQARHAEDPKRIRWQGEDLAWSVLYHRHLMQWVGKVEPEPPEAMRLAAACQHLERWKIPRSDFPAGVTGYKQWRSRLAQFHAQQAAEVLAQSGYDGATQRRVRDFLIKKGRKKDPQVQHFEDAVCLTFMELQLAEFARAHDEPKLLNIIRKTWAKMSPDGHGHALELVNRLPADTARLVKRALERG